MGLLVVQVLDAVLHLAQKHIRLRQLQRRIGRQQPGRGQAFEGAERGAGAQLRKLPAAHHLQQLYDEFDLADTAARQLHIVGALRVGGAALGRVLADLAVQDAQRVEHAVVQVAAENKGCDQRAQGAGARRADGRLRRDHARFEPGQALPFAALALKIVLQRAQRNRVRPRVAVGPQREIDAEHKAVLGHAADQGVHGAHQFAKVFLRADDAAWLTAGLRHTGGVAVAVEDINQIDVAGHIELARAELAHAQNAQACRRVFLVQRRAVLRCQFAVGVLVGGVQREFGQVGHGLGDPGQGQRLRAVQRDQALEHQLAGDAQGGCGVGGRLRQQGG